MATIPNGVLCLWPSTNASVPAGWTRFTAYDGKYALGTTAGVNPGGSGGAATHTHASLVHSQALAVNSTFVQTTVGAGSIVDGYVHSHGIGQASSVDFTCTDAGSFGSTASDPPLALAIIYIQSSGAATGVPANGWCYWYQAALPASWTDAGWWGYYVKGPATGADSASGAGSGASHLHVSASHTHTITHGHGAAASGPETTIGTGAPPGGSGSNLSDVGHTHNVQCGNGGGVSETLTITNITGTPNSGATTWEPPYNTLALINNNTGAAALPAYAILLWTGFLASIPADWVLCDSTNGTPDMRGLFPKAASYSSGSYSDLGVTGGTLGHVHTNPSGTHTHDLSHTHTCAYIGDNSAGRSVTAGGGTALPNLGHSHTLSSTTSTSTALLSDAVAQQLDPSTISTDLRPPYVMAAFIMFQPTMVPTITAPTINQVESLPTFTVSWSFDVPRLQVDYRVIIYASDGVTIIYDSGTVVSASTSITVPVGYLVDSTNYKVAVTCTDSGHANATSAQVPFSTSWSQPSSVGTITVTKVNGT